MKGDKKIPGKYQKLFKMIDDYLIGDLETIFKLPIQEKGDLGFTAFQVITSGIELLGLLISGLKDTNAFNYMLNTYFVKLDSWYGDNNIQKLMRESGRNGIAHIFMSYGSIVISRTEGTHLRVYSYDKVPNLIINCKTYYENFKKVYKNVKDKVTNGEIKELKGYKELLDRIQCGKFKIKALIEGELEEVLEFQDYFKGSFSSPWNPVITDRVDRNPPPHPSGEHTL